MSVYTDRARELTCTTIASEITKSASKIFSFKKDGNVTMKIPNTIAIEGLIGVGKSTLCKNIKRTHNEEVDIFEEPTEESFLSLFYKDKQKYGFALQLVMLKTRQYQLKLCERDAEFGRRAVNGSGVDMVFWDRSMFGDHIFAMWNHLQGNISLDEMNVYEKYFGGSFANFDSVLGLMRPLSLIVMIDDEPSRCKYRAEHWRANQSEQGIPLAYYKGLDDIHFYMMTKLFEATPEKTMIQLWSLDQNPSLLLEQYRRKIEGTTRTNWLKRMNEKKVLEHAREWKIYSDETLVMAMYNDLSDATSRQTLAEKLSTIPQTVAFSSNIMTRNAVVKNNLVPDHVARYPDLKFFKNAYKRVVLFHLAVGHNVVFYD
jgi:deoxyadenosine/deoxycytidine kinase